MPVPEANVQMIVRLTHLVFIFNHLELHSLVRWISHEYEQQIRHDFQFLQILQSYTRNSFFLSEQTMERHSNRLKPLKS